MRKDGLVFSTIITATDVQPCWMFLYSAPTITIYPPRLPGQRALRRPKATSAVPIKVNSAWGPATRNILRFRLVLQMHLFIRLLSETFYSAVPTTWSPPAQPPAVNTARPSTTVSSAPQTSSSNSATTISTPRNQDRPPTPNPNVSATSSSSAPSPSPSNDPRTRS